MCISLCELYAKINEKKRRKNKSRMRKSVQKENKQKKNDQKLQTCRLHAKSVQPVFARCTKQNALSLRTTKNMNVYKKKKKQRESYLLILIILCRKYRRDLNYNAM